MLTIGEPRNIFPLDAGAKHDTLLAGGIGVSPMLSMAQHLAASGASFELRYRTRSVEHTAVHMALSTQALARNVYFHCAINRANLRPYLRDHCDTAPSVRIVSLRTATFQGLR